MSRRPKRSTAAATAASAVAASATSPCTATIRPSPVSRSATAGFRSSATTLAPAVVQQTHDLPADAACGAGDDRDLPSNSLMAAMQSQGLGGGCGGSTCRAMAGDDAKSLIELAVTRFQEEVPALANLKLVFGVELRGGRDVQMYRVELPGPKVTKGIAEDARVRVEMQRSFFNVMAKEGKAADWREAFMYGQAKATGPTQILQLIEHVVDKHEERLRLRRARSSR